VRYLGITKKKSITWCIFLAMLMLFFFSLPCNTTSADEVYTTFNTPRFILLIDRTQDSKGNQEIQLANLAQSSISILNNTYEELSRVFRTEPTKKVVLRFLSPEQFRRQTGAPSWTSAMYFRDEISIPLTNQTGLRMDELKRALRHEYVHAVVAELSHYRAPAWLDEGVAQLIEGQPNPLLGPALRDWARVNAAMPLDWLQNGFTTLDSAIVPAAYAESLFAVRKIVHTRGFSGITNYLNFLGQGVPEKQAFAQAFDVNPATFERQLTAEMHRWAQSGQVNP
jgi:hypothetical protein